MDKHKTMINASINWFLILVPEVPGGRRQDEQRYSRYTGLVWNRLRHKTPPPSCTGDRCLFVHISTQWIITKKFPRFCLVAPEVFQPELLLMWKRIWAGAGHCTNTVQLNLWCNIGLKLRARSTSELLFVYSSLKIRSKMCKIRLKFMQSAAISKPCKLQNLQINDS